MFTADCGCCQYSCMLRCAAQLRHEVSVASARVDWAAAAHGCHNAGGCQPYRWSKLPRTNTEWPPLDWAAAAAAAAAAAEAAAESSEGAGGVSRQSLAGENGPAGALGCVP